MSESKHKKSNFKTKNIENKKVLVGMTGGIDSTAAAFLLKKQGLECIGISIIFLKKEFLQQFFDNYLKIEEKNILAQTKESQKSVQEKLNNLYDNNCTVKDLNRVKNICHKLNIPFYCIDASEEYKELILKKVIASQLSGELFSPCVWANNLKMDLLLQKRKKFGAKYIATGHYAKIHQNISDKRHKIFTANDLLNDQSYLLSSLEERHLENLILPLSDLRKKDAIKLLKSFKLPVDILRDSNKMCFSKHITRTILVEITGHTKLSKTGGIYLKKGNAQLSNHLGIHHFSIGQKGSEITGGKNEVLVDSSYYVTEISNNGNVYLGTQDDLLVSSCTLVDVNNYGLKNQTFPKSIIVQIGINIKKFIATIFFRNNGIVELKFEKPIYGPMKGLHVAFYDKEGSSAKVLGCGRISHIKSEETCKLENKLINEFDEEELNDEQKSFINKLKKSKELHH